MGLGDLSVTQSLFGNGSSPGVMGTGQQRFTQPQMGNVKRDKDGNPIMDITQQPGESDEDYTKRAQRYFDGDASAGNVVYETDPYKAWQDPQADARRAQLQSQSDKYENRTISGDARIDRGDLQNITGVSLQDAYGFQQGQGARVGQYQVGKAAQLTPAERVRQEQIGQANQMNAAQIDPAAQARAAQLGRQDAEFRGGQTQLMGQLQEQAAGRGPSLAAGQLREATDRNIAQQAGMAASQGGSSAVQQRQLASGAAQANQQAGRDAAQMRIQEQLAARQQLQGVTQTGREQDINVANAQAQLQQQTALANQAAINARAGQQAGFQQGANQFNANALNDRQYQQAQMNMQAQLANQQAGNQFALQQGQFGQQMNMANMEQYNQRQALQAQLYQQGGLATQAQMNQQQLQEGAWAQQAGLANQQYQNQALFANQQAAMQNQQMNDAMTRYYQEAGLGLDARQQQAMMAYQGMQQQTALGYAGLSQKAYEGAREGIGGMMGGVGSAVGALAMFSDEEVKNSVTRGDDKIGSFLSQYMDSIEQQNAQNLAPEPKKDSGGGLMGGMGSSMASAGAMSAMSDEKAKNLGAENDKLKAQMVGMSMNQGSHGKGFFGGLGGGIASGAQTSMAMDKANANSAVAKKPDPSSTMTPVMNNPNAAIAVPGYAGAQQMSPSYGGLPVRDNPYGAPPAQQTWGVPPPQPATVPPATMPAGMSNMNNPYGPPLQTWSDKNTKSYSPAGMKQGIGSGDMKISNFLSSIYGRGGAGSNPRSGGSGSVAGGPVSYESLSNGGENVAATGQSMNNQSMMYANNPGFTGDYAPGVGTFNTMSDKKVKEFVDGQKAYDYEYKPQYKDEPLAGEGRYVSPMAQDLQKTELGKSMVTKGPDGKLVVDYGKGFGTIVAAQAYLNERLNELEAKKGKK